jgi:hypothetical protein
MDVLGRRRSWTSLLLCGLVILAAALAVAVFGFGVAAWIAVMGAFCVVMMGSMVWMMVSMGRNASHRR